MPPLELQEGLTNGTFKILVDVRRTDEWSQGHIPNATFAENLALDGVQPPAEVMRCVEQGNCPIVVSCRSGGRAAVAIERLINLFNATEDSLFNGQGVSQWTSAGLKLSTDPSKDPMCEQRNNDNKCELMEDMEEEVEIQSLPPVISLSADELYNGMMAEQFDVVLDVRSFAEFEAGHIANVSFVDGLATSGVVPELLLFKQMGNDGEDANETMSSCRARACHIAVTCRSGNRAGVAIERLQKEFKFEFNQFYNGGGTLQWEQAGYPLVTTLESVIPKCALASVVSSLEDAVARNATLDGIDEFGNCTSCCMASLTNETVVEIPEESMEGMDDDPKDAMNSLETMDDDASPAMRVVFVLVAGVVVAGSIF